MRFVIQENVALIEYALKSEAPLWVKRSIAENVKRNICYFNAAEQARYRMLVESLEGKVA